MVGGVRTAISTVTSRAPARSAAISEAELPAPTTRTRFPRYAAGLRYFEEWINGGLKVSRPGQFGMRGSVHAPVASTTRCARIEPSDVNSTQASPSSARSTCSSIPNCGLLLNLGAYHSRYATKSSRATQGPDVSGMAMLYWQESH